jgi:hemerythrin-like domain-containing protein
MSHEPFSSRRNFIRISAAAGTGILVAGFGAATAAGADNPPRRPTGKTPPKNPKPAAKPEKDDKDEGAEEDITPPEDLMRQHGVQSRLLLIWDEAARRIARKLDFPVDALHDAAKLMRSFVEDYHQHLEEEYIFPKFREAKLLVPTVDTLKAQHAAGRKATDVVLQLATASDIKDADSRAKIADAMRQAIRMYHPHMAREDTVLFPAFRDVISQDDYDKLEDAFDAAEDKHLGEDGFAKVVEQVAAIEKKFGIIDLAHFTAKI